MISRTMEILNRQICMVRDEKNRRCCLAPVYTLTMQEKNGHYRIVANESIVILSCFDSITECQIALAECKALFFVE